MDRIEIIIENVDKGFMLYIGTTYSIEYKKFCKDRQEINNEIVGYVNNYEFVVKGV